MSVFDDVRQFMLIAHPDKLSDVPRIPPDAVDDLCQKLIEEEHKELKKAWVDEDLVEISDAIADLIWVLICMAQCYGIPIEKVWEEVAKTNMSKFPGGVITRRSGDGKVIKPPGWKPPDIKRILEEAYRLAEHKTSPTMITCEKCGAWFEHDFDKYPGDGWKDQPCPKEREHA